MEVLMMGAYTPQLGGVSQVVQNLVKELKKTNKVYVVNVEVKGYPVGLGHWKDGTVDVYQEKMWFVNRYTSLQTLFQTTKRALLLSKKVDIYHAHGPFFAGAGFIDRGKPLVVTFHGYPSLETLGRGRIKKNSPQYKFMRWIEKKVAERADAIIAVGKTLREWIITELGVEPEKVFHVPNGVDVEKFKPQKTKNRDLFGLKEGDRVLLFVKAFTKQNGISYLIDAMPKIHEVYPSVKLLAVGGGPLKGYLERKVSKYNLSETIHLMDRIPHDLVPSLLNTGDIYISPSVPVGGAQETFGISLIEAMATELTVVATAVGGPKEILEEGERQMGKPVGILIPPEDPDAIAEAVIYLLEHPDEAREMGKRARDFVVNNYTWEKTAEKTLEVYKYAIGRHPQR